MSEFIESVSPLQDCNNMISDITYLAIKHIYIFLYLHIYWWSASWIDARLKNISSILLFHLLFISNMSTVPEHTHSCSKCKLISNAFISISFSKSLQQWSRSHGPLWSWSRERDRNIRKNKCICFFIYHNRVSPW